MDKLLINILNFKVKTFAEIGGVTGTGLSIVINYEYILSRSIETAIIAGVGGAAGIIGSLLVAFISKKVLKN